MSRQRCVRVLVAATIVAAILAPAGCSRKASDEQRAERMTAAGRHAAERKAAGWKTMMAVMAAMAAQGGMMSAQRGNVSVQFMHGREDRTGVFVAFEGREQRGPGSPGKSGPQQGETRRAA